jgi:Uma2 family endonuclease
MPSELEFELMTKGDQVMPTLDHGTIVINCAYALITLRVKGKLLDSSVEFRVQGRSVFPDFSFVSTGRLKLSGGKYPTVLPEFVLEVTSPTDKALDESEKAKWYLEHGCTMVVYANPVMRSVLVYQNGKPAKLLNYDKSFKFNGIRVKISDLFEGV